MKKYILISGLIMLIDQVSKYFVELYLYDKQTIIIENMLAFSYIRNTGGAWGILKPFPLIFIFVVPIIIILIIFNMKKSDNNMELFAWSSIIGGALGNYTDRVFRGYVVDFIDLFAWPVFNFADTFIVLGCTLLVKSIFTKSK